MKAPKLIFGILTITAALTMQVQAQSFITNGLVAYYPFNGNANDASGNGNNGIILKGDFTANRFGNPSSAFENPTCTDGYDWGIDTQIGNLYETNFTLTVWYESPPTAGGFLITHGIAGYVDPFLDVSLGSLTFRASAPQNWLQYNDSSVTNGNWHFVVATLSGNADCLYFDGNLVAVGNNPMPSSSGTWKLASVAFPIDDVRIYNRALSSNEVAQLYAIESAPIINIQKAVYLTVNNLWTGSNYQLQASSDLTNWTNQGSVFTATTNFWQSTNYWNVVNWNQLFFRMQLSP